MKRTKRASGGFTLVEMLCTIVILLLMSGLMATGIRLGVTTLRRSVMMSESQVLCSTLRSIVNDELRFSGTTSTDGETISFFSQNYGEGVSFSTDENGQVTLGGNKVLTARSYPYGIRAYVTIKSYDPDSRVFTATVLVTTQDGSTLAQTSFEAKQLNEPAGA